MVHAEYIKSHRHMGGRIGLHILPFVLLFALLLSALSIFQKMILGADPFALKGFVVPVLFGGFSGAAIGSYLKRINTLNLHLRGRVEELEALNEKVSSLEKLLPICVNCKRIRIPGGDPEDQKDWEYVETYISKHTQSEFSHGICPECKESIYPEDSGK